MKDQNRVIQLVDDACVAYNMLFDTKNIGLSE